MATFSGFRHELLEFLAGLRANNSREWFQDHRRDYDTFLLEPARQFVAAIGELTPELGPNVHAEPKVHGSIFAINRDTRFSADKTPYKANLDLWFWQGSGTSRECPGYFFRLTPESLILGAGMHGFSERALERYRRAVLHEAHGQRLAQAADTSAGTVGGRTYKRVPAGLPADHPRADWLRHSGLFAEFEFQPVPPQFFEDVAPAWCIEQFRRVAPLQQWLVEQLVD